MSDQEMQMTLIEHLTELRYRLIRAALGVFVGMGACIYFSEYLLSVIRKPVLPYLGQGGLVFTGVMDKFLAHIKIGALGGIILTCPYWLYHLWMFISPGLYKNERRYVMGFIVSGTVLFLAGVAFVYYIVYPEAFKYLFTVGGDIDKPMITIDQYLSFFVITTLMFGLSFELPVVLVVLGMVGVIDSMFLRKYRRYAVVGLAAVAAIITPPDLISMLMMLIPLVVLYEASIWIIYFMIEKKKKPDEV